MTEANPRPRLPRAVLALAAVSLLTDASSEMILPLLPAFLAGLGAGPLFIGALEGAADAVASLLKLYSGRLSDRLPRKKPLVLFGYGLSSVARSLSAVGLYPWHFLAIRISDRVGKGLRTSPRDALLADAVAGADRGRAFGFHRAADHAGAVVAAGVSSLLLWLFYGQGAAEGPEFTAAARKIFAVAAAPAILSVLTLAIFVKEAPAAPKTAGGAGRPGAPLSPGLKRFLVVAAVFALGNSPDTLLLLRATELGIGAGYLPALWGGFHLIKSALSTPMGALSDRLGRREVIGLGFALYAAAYLLFAFAAGPGFFAGVFLFYGAYYAFVEGAASALVADLSAPEGRGRAFGAYHATVGLAALPSALLAGRLWEAYGAPLALGVGAALAGLAAALLFALVPGKATSPLSPDEGKR